MITKVTHADGSYIDYGYDDIYQLTNETRTGTNAYSISYTYDKVGNRETMTKNSITTDYTYNTNNQLTTETIDSDTVITYAYDDNGNLISKVDGADTTLYEWDYENRLVQMTNDQIPMTINYEYDPDGNRISKTANSVTTKYINDVALPLVQVLMETTDEDTVLATYTYGNDLISSTKYDILNTIYYHYDGLGSVRQLTDDNETVTASYTYDAFGNVIVSTGTTDNTYGFTGEQQFDEADGLVFLRARYYDSRVGRFISRDPILSPRMTWKGHIWSLDLLILQPRHLCPYVYTSNNPVNLLDPAGLASQRPGCDVVGDIFPYLNENRCTRACCDAHDDCYAANNCGVSSWAPCFGSPECNKCNADVASCFIGCATLPGLW